MHHPPFLVLGGDVMLVWLDHEVVIDLALVNGVLCKGQASLFGIEVARSSSKDDMAWSIIRLDECIPCVSLADGGGYAFEDFVIHLEDLTNLLAVGMDDVGCARLLNFLESGVCGCVWV